MSDVTPTQRRLLGHVVRDTDLQLRVAEALGIDLEGRPIEPTEPDHA